jgi:hypothetical protein
MSSISILMCSSTSINIDSIVSIAWSNTALLEVLSQVMIVIVFSITLRYNMQTSAWDIAQHIISPESVCVAHRQSQHAVIVHTQAT